MARFFLRVISAVFPLEQCAGSSNFVAKFLANGCSQGLGRRLIEDVMLSEHTIEAYRFNLEGVWLLEHS